MSNINTIILRTKVDTQNPSIRFKDYKYKLADVDTMKNIIQRSEARPSDILLKTKVYNAYTGLYSNDSSDKEHYSKYTNYIPAGIYFDTANDDNDSSNVVFNTYKNIAYLNNLNLFNNIDEYRKNTSSTIRLINYFNDFDTNTTLMESIPNYLSTDKIEDVLDRTIVNKEYERKVKMLDLFNKIIDKDFTAGNWKAGKFNELSMIQYYNDEYLEAHPFIRIENANPNLKAFLLVRGVKVPMNVIETSHNGTGKINYIIQYPKYLLNKFTEHYAAIEGILIPKEFYNNNTKFYTGFDDLFGDSVSRNTYQENSVSMLNTIV